MLLSDKDEICGAEDVTEAIPLLTGSEDGEIDEAVAGGVALAIGTTGDEVAGDG